LIKLIFFYPNSNEPESNIIETSVEILEDSRHSTKNNPLSDYSHPMSS